MLLQECIKPVEVERLPGKGGAIRIRDDGSYVQIGLVSFYLFIYLFIFYSG